ncbi:MAG: type II secretion system F family protein [Lachnospirales bacterium]
MTYIYKGFNKDGMKIGGAGNFKNEESVASHLDDIGISGYLIFKSETEYKSKVYKLISPKELSIFCRQMSVMFFSYITIMEGVSMLEEQTDNKALKLALKEVYGHMETGLTFAECISMYPHIFGGYLIEMVNIGEESGNLDKVFKELAIYFRKESDTRKKVKSAVLYPVAMAVIMFALIVYLIKQVLPVFDSMLTNMGVTTNSITSIVLSVGSFFNSFLLPLCFVIVVVFVGLYFYFKSEKGSYNWDVVKLKIPVVKFVIHRVVTARFARSLSILLKSGINLVSAVEQSIPLIENAYLEEKFVVALEKIKNGEKLADSLKEIGIFPTLFIKMVVIGDTTGNLDQMLENTAELFEEQVDDAIRKTTSIIEPLLITILSIVVGMILLGIMIPMINIMRGI